MFYSILSTSRRTSKFLCNGVSIFTNSCYLLQTPSLRIAISPISTCRSVDTTFTLDNSFTTSYLVNSCRLSKDIAISASKKVQLKTSAQPDSVLALFRNHEFSDTQISKIIHKCPNLLLACPDKTLMPKLEFFNSIGIFGPILARILCRNPTILCYSLERKIKPVITFLQGLGLTQSDIIKLIMRTMWVLSKDPQTKLTPAIALLQTHGVPDYYISKLLVKNAGTFLNTNRLTEIVEEIIKLKFEPSKASFIEAIVVMSCLTKSSWDAKCSIYKRWGWSEEDIHKAFRRYPVCMGLSEMKIMGAMEYFVNKMQYNPLVIANCPQLLGYSLEKRIIPRMSVVHLLITNGFLKKNYSIHRALAVVEDEFVEKFVTKYVEKVPQLSNAYLNKLKCSVSTLSRT